MALLPFRPGCSPDLRDILRRCPSSGSRGRTPARQPALALRPVLPSGIAHPQNPVTLRSRRDPQSGRAASCAFVGLGSVVPLLQGRTAPSLHASLPLSRDSAATGRHRHGSGGHRGGRARRLSGPPPLGGTSLATSQTRAVRCCYPVRGRLGPHRVARARAKETPMARCPYCAKELTGTQPACPDHMHLWQQEPRQRTFRSSVPTRSAAKRPASRSSGRRGGRGR